MERNIPNPLLSHSHSAHYCLRKINLDQINTQGVQLLTIGYGVSSISPLIATLIHLANLTVIETSLERATAAHNQQNILSLTTQLLNGQPRLTLIHKNLTEFVNSNKFAFIFFAGMEKIKENQDKFFTNMVQSLVPGGAFCIASSGHDTNNSFMKIAERHLNSKKWRHLGLHEFFKWHGDLTEEEIKKQLEEKDLVIVDTHTYQHTNSFKNKDAFLEWCKEWIESNPTLNLMKGDTTHELLNDIIEEYIQEKGVYDPANENIIYTTSLLTIIARKPTNDRQEL